MDNTKQTEAPAEVDPRYPNTPIGIVRSRDAFLRALPELLANPKYDRWCVAYCGEERIALARTQAEVIRECQRRGVRADECYLGCVAPQGGDDEEVEPRLGLLEFDEFEDGDART
jgi:hypothetical protein